MTLEELMNAPAPASRWVLERDCEETGLNPDDIRAEMLRRIGEMRASIERAQVVLASATHLALVIGLVWFVIVLIIAFASRRGHRT